MIHRHVTVSFLSDMRLAEETYIAKVHAHLPLEDAIIRVNEGRRQKVG